MLSRTADHLFWMSRYTERAENTARMLNVNYETSMLPQSAEVSQTAGTFVCNHVFYGLMHRLATARGLKRTRGGFIHVPMLPEQGAPSLPLDQMVEGLRVGIRTALTVQQDVRAVGGATD